MTLISHIATKNDEFQSYWTEILNDQKPNNIICPHYKHPKKKSDTNFINGPNK